MICLFILRSPHSLKWPYSYNYTDFTVLIWLLFKLYKIITRLCTNKRLCSKRDCLFTAYMKAIFAGAFIDSIQSCMLVMTFHSFYIAGIENTSTIQFSQTALYIIRSRSHHVIVARLVECINFCNHYTHAHDHCITFYCAFKLLFFNYLVDSRIPYDSNSLPSLVGLAGLVVLLLLIMQKPFSLYNQHTYQ